MDKQSWEKSEKRKEGERRSEKRKSQKKEDPDARKGLKVAKHSVFPTFWPSGQLKSRLAKAVGAEPSGQMRNQKLHASVARSRFWSQNAQHTSVSDHFWKLKCWKVHTGVARSAFRSQNVQNTPGPEHLHQRCSEVRALISLERLHFGVSDHQVSLHDFAWQMQHFVWPGLTFSRLAQYF